MNSKIQPFFRPFEECDSYTQDDAAGLSFRKVLPEGIISDLDMGLVTGRGPTHKFSGAHVWDQVYLVFSGKGYIHLNGQKYRIDRPGIVVIPKGTNHSMEVDAGEVMQYVYVNRRGDDKMEIEGHEKNT
jgi:mannose-6-phosphate isomerase-like protein (cupin superfamily)